MMSLSFRYFRCIELVISGDYWEIIMTCGSCLVIMIGN